MYVCKSFKVVIRSSNQPSSSLKALRISSLSVRAAISGLSFSMTHISKRCHPYRQNPFATACASACIFFTCIGFLTPRSAIAREEQLETARDKNLKELLLKANGIPSFLLLAEKSAQMNAYRNKYLEVLKTPDYAARLDLSTRTAGNRGKQYSLNVDALLSGVFQFGGNWRSDFEWSMANSIKENSTLLNHNDTAIVRLNSLSLTYGRERSTESTIGLLDETPLLQGQGVYPGFSGARIRVHPKHPYEFRGELRAEFEIEHGLMTPRNPLQAGGFSSAQRTRPKVLLTIENTTWTFASSAMLEWYSDPDGIVGNISGGRTPPLPLNGSQAKQAPETRWRPFHLSLAGKSRLSPDLMLTGLFERVSNPIGESTRPAWSFDTGLENNGQIGGEHIKSNLSLQLFKAPAVSLPVMRLPLEMNPDTQGLVVRAALTWLPASLQNHSFSMNFGQIQETRIGNWGQDHCQPPLASFPRDTTDTCKTWWFSLKWSQKSVTNL